MRPLKGFFRTEVVFEDKNLVQQEYFFIAVNLVKSLFTSLEEFERFITQLDVNEVEGKDEFIDFYEQNKRANFPIEFSFSKLRTVFTPPIEDENMPNFELIDELLKNGGYIKYVKLQHPTADAPQAHQPLDFSKGKRGPLSILWKINDLYHLLPLLICQNLPLFQPLKCPIVKNQLPSYIRLHNRPPQYFTQIRRGFMLVKNIFFFNCKLGFGIPYD